MYQSQLKFLMSTVYVGLLLFCSKTSALEFEPGIGGAIGYTDNIRLANDNPEDELIAVGYLGGRLQHDTGPVQADATASLNHLRYTKDTFADQRYFNLTATVDWEMVENQFDWFLQNYYGQRTINTVDLNTPNNIQDSNIFTLGANINYPVSDRQAFALRPEYRNFYYESSQADNQQYSLTASWNNQMYRLTNIGLSASLRAVDYEQPDIVDASFGSLYFVVTANRARSDLTFNIGYNGVRRDNGQKTSEPAGNLNWLINLTSLSSLRAFISTGLTDTSSANLYAVVDPGVGDPNNVQVTTDVIRNTGMSLGYYRVDRTLESSITGELRELNYSESLNDRRIKQLNASLNYPLTALLSGGLNARFRNTDLTDTDITQKRYAAGANITYQLSRSLRSQFDLFYRHEITSDLTRDYSAWSVYVNLVYGFGGPARPSGLVGF